ncbi:hypothetical protein B0H10DRAFT_2214640 [Mycena sp. CBHHK59/15]|nr:hypothetical protein B0H10DRAFT_2214640 [Mycena sp. CBHHK59/15]
MISYKKPSPPGRRRRDGFACRLTIETTAVPVDGTAHSPTHSHLPYQDPQRRHIRRLGGAGGLFMSITPTIFVSPEAARSTRHTLAIGEEYA